MLGRKSETTMTGNNFKPKILIFAAEMAYRAADAAGLTKAEYPSNTYIIRIPCSSLIRPDLVLYAFKKGFDGVLIASSGDDCPFMGEACIEKTSKRAEKAYELLEQNGIERERFKVAGICSTCVEALRNQIQDLNDTLISLGPLKK